MIKPDSLDLSIAPTEPSPSLFPKELTLRLPRDFVRHLSTEHSPIAKACMLDEELSSHREKDIAINQDKEEEKSFSKVGKKKESKIMKKKKELSKRIMKEPLEGSNTPEEDTKESSYKKSNIIQLRGQKQGKIIREKKRYRLKGRKTSLVAGAGKIKGLDPEDDHFSKLRTAASPMPLPQDTMMRTESRQSSVQSSFPRTLQSIDIPDNVKIMYSKRAKGIIRNRSCCRRPGDMSCSSYFCCVSRYSFKHYKLFYGYEKPSIYNKRDKTDLLKQDVFTFSAFCCFLMSFISLCWIKDFCCKCRVNGCGETIGENCSGCGDQKKICGVKDFCMKCCFCFCKGFGRCLKSN